MLELGGKSSNIICDDADVAQAVKWSEMGIYGILACSAGSRIFVQEGVYDNFVKEFLAASKARRAGDPFLQETQDGPITSKIQFDRVMNYIDIGKKEGANLLCGGEQIGSDGFFIQPTIFTETTRDMRIVREEIFGPVAVIIKFKTDEEVIEVANDTSYGLAAAVFTKDLNRAVNISNSLEAGTVFVNCYGWADDALPWSGYKQSGWGSENGEEALSHYSQYKSVHINLAAQL